MSESNPTNPDQTGADREDAWQPCAPGEISGMVSQLQDRRRAVVVGRTTFVAAMVLLVAAASQFSGLTSPDDLADVPGSSEHDCGGILCSAAVAQLEAYRSGTLDEKTTEQVRAHLEECPLCGPKFRDMTGGSARVEADSPGSSLAMAGFAR